MSVDFGRPQTAWYGKSKLAKAINQGGFGISTGLGIDKVQEAAVQACRDFPVKKARLVRSPMKPVIMTRKGVEIIVCGIINTNKETGKEYLLMPSWELALGSGTDLNELERNLRHLDPQATVELIAA